MAGQQRRQTQEEAARIARSLQQLTGSAQQIANCLGFLAIRFSEYRKKPDSECIPFLNSLGFDRNAIAAILGTTPNTVSVRLSKVKSSRKPKQSPAPEGPDDAAD